MPLKVKGPQLILSSKSPLNYEPCQPTKAFRLHLAYFIVIVQINQAC